MQRVRRLASAAVVASLAVAGLSACRSDPAVAAYYGDTGRISEDQVQAIWNDAHERLVAAAKQQPPADGASAPADRPVTMPISRTNIVATLLGAQVLNRLAQEQNVSAPAAENLAEYANALHLPTDATYVKLYAQQISLLSLLKSAAKNAPTPSDDEFRQVYDALAQAGQLDPSMDFDTFKQKLPEQNLQLVKASAQVRDEIIKAAGPLHVKVNPRYQPLTIPVLEFQTQDGSLKTLMTAPLGGNEAAAPVVDAR